MPIYELQVFSSWMHFCAVRVFSESILRYGLPPSFLVIWNNFCSHVLCCFACPFFFLWILVADACVYIYIYIINNFEYLCFSLLYYHPPLKVRRKSDPYWKDWVMHQTGITTVFVFVFPFWPIILCISSATGTYGTGGLWDYRRDFNLVLM